MSKKSPTPKGAALMSAIIPTASGDKVPLRRLNLPRRIEAARLKEMRVRFESGDGNALFRAIAHCGNQAIPMPEWVVAAYFRAMNRWWSYEVKTLDEAFGIRFPKGSQLAAFKKRRRLAPLVHEAIERLRAEGRPVNNALYGEVGAKLGIGKTPAQEYYRYWKGELGLLRSPALDALLEPFMTADARLEKATRKVTKLSGSGSRKRAAR